MKKKPSLWELDCLKDRGRVLKGIYSHYCPDWDGLCIDETCVNEWPCVCKDSIDRKIAEGNWRIDDDSNGREENSSGQSD